jgi:hypothetical protein
MPDRGSATDDAVDATGTAVTDLQFDRVTIPDVAPGVIRNTTRDTAGAGGDDHPDAAPARPSPAVVCSSCQRTIATTYFDVNGQPFCGSCRTIVQSQAQTPRGVGPLLRAAFFGLGAGIVGAAIYYAVIAITNFEIGLVAILIGYMVGYSVRKGARDRGGLRFQVLAALLTYASVAMAYAPLAVSQAFEEGAKSAQTESNSAPSGAQPADATATESGATLPISDPDSNPDGADSADPAGTAAPLGAGGLVLALATVAGLIAILPVVVVFGSLPSGLISALIIGVGMRQAWTMTGNPPIAIRGPYRVGGTTPDTAPA